MPWNKINIFSFTCVGCWLGRGTPKKNFCLSLVCYVKAGCSRLLQFFYSFAHDWCFVLFHCHVWRVKNLPCLCIYKWCPLSRPLLRLCHVSNCSRKLIDKGGECYAHLITPLIQQIQLHKAPNFNQTLFNIQEKWLMLTSLFTESERFFLTLS